MIHFLQSPAWEAFQRSLGHKTFRHSGDGWEYMAILETSGGLRRLYCPYGPYAEDEHSFRNALTSLKQLAHQQAAVYVRVQPLGYDASHFPELHYVPYSQPAHTWCINLSVPEDDIVAQMKQNNRSIYRNYAKKGLVYSTSRTPEDAKYLTRLLHGVATHNQITVHSDSYLHKQAEILLQQQAALLHFISYEDEIIAAALCYEDNEVVYYAHAAADHEHRKLNASTALLAEIIIDAKRRGKKTCDLYGITTSADPHHRWGGFTKFKKSFGGYEKTLSETYEVPVKKLPYYAYHTARKIRRLASR